MDRLPDHYALTSVTFGDRPSGAISTMALQMTAEMFQTEYPEAAELLIKTVMWMIYLLRWILFVRPRK